LCPQQPGAGRGPAVHPPGGPPALAGRRGADRGARGAERRIDAAGRRPVRGAADERAPRRGHRARRRLMDDPNLTCTDEQRSLRAWQEGLNGLDYLEVSDDQRTLTLFLFDGVPQDFDAGNVRIEGGAAGTAVEVTEVIRCGDSDEEREDQVEV